jgi:hypothetical protein
MPRTKKAKLNAERIKVILKINYAELIAADVTMNVKARLGDDGR